MQLRTPWWAYTCHETDRSKSLFAVRVAGVESGDHLVVLAARLAVAQELDALHLNLIGVRLGFQQPHELVDEFAEWHRVVVFPLSGNKIGPHRRRHELLQPDAGVAQLQAQ